MNSSASLDDNELATLLLSKGDALASGDKSREQVIRETLELLGGDPLTVKRGRVYDDGRTSFGRKHAGQGVAVFLPDDADGDHGGQA